MPEPVTALTDVLLAAVYGVLSIRILRRTRARATRYGAAALMGTAVSATFGGAHHGLHPGDPLYQPFWQAAMATAGLASFCFAAAGLTVFFRGGLRRVLISLAILKLALYALISAGDRGDFRIVLVDYSIALLVLALCAGRNRWVLGGVWMSIAAVATQQSGYAPHANFNHHSIYHLLQIAAGYMFYRGFLLLPDVPAPPPAKPGPLATAAPADAG